MKPFLKIAFVGLLLTASQTGFGQDPNFHIFLCFGQSNMEGQGTMAVEDWTVDERFQVFWALDCDNIGRTKETWYPAVPPLTRCYTRLSPADYFGRTMVENLPEGIKVGVINVSVGGCKIELFDKDTYQSYINTVTEDWLIDIIAEYDNNPYGYLVDLATKAQQHGVIKGILLHQGESNTGDNQWPSKVKKIYEDLVTDLNLDPTETPLLAGEVVHADQEGICASMNTIINKLPETLPNSYVISSSQCTAASDKVHFDREGYKELGRRYAAKMLELVDGEVVPLSLITPAENLSASIYPNPTKDQLTITYTLPESGPVSIKLYDLMGKEVESILKTNRPAGTHQLTHSLVDQPKSIYFLRLESDYEMVMRKVLVR